MANVINATSTGNGGLITTGDDSGVLNIQTNETTAISIDASQNATFTNGANLPNTFGFKNRVINGNMAIAQRGVGPTTCSQQVTTYALDRFGIYKDNSSATVTMTQSSTAPAGFSKSLLVTPTTGSAPTAAQELQLRQSIEGYNVADFGWGTADAVNATLSFWVRSSLTGTFAFAIQSYGSGTTYVTTYTINSANTWEYKTITIPKVTTGTWAADNNPAINLIWDLGGGSNYNTTANTWTSGNYYTVSGTTKLVGTTNATFYITGVQFEKGSAATSFDFRSYGTELALCQRYYWLCNGATYQYSIPGSGDIGGNSMFNITFPVPMRATPATISYSGTAPWFYYNSAGGVRQQTNLTSVNSFGAGTNAMRVIASGVGASGLFSWIDIGGSATGAFSISAEF